MIRASFFKPTRLCVDPCNDPDCEISFEFRFIFISFFLFFVIFEFLQIQFNLISNRYRGYYMSKIRRSRYRGDLGCNMNWMICSEDKDLSVVGTSGQPDSSAIGVIVNGVPCIVNSALECEGGKEGDLHDLRNASPTMARLSGNPCPIPSTPPTHMLESKSAQSLTNNGITVATYELPEPVLPKLKSTGLTVNGLPAKLRVTAGLDLQGNW